MDPPPEFMSGPSDPSIGPSRRTPQRRGGRGKQFQQTHFNSPSQSTNFGGATQLFEDTSHYHDPGMVQQQQQQPMQQQQPQMFPGAQFVNDPMANMALQYGSTMASTGKEFMEQKIDHFLSVSKLKYYFAVDTSYVIRKLGLLLFPFAHQNWAIKYNKSEPVAPRYELNAPDLYIPVMGFVTYVLVCGLVLGTQSRFTPEQLGVTASSAFVWLIVEIVAIIVTLYVFGISADVKYLDLVAFCGYKYVGMIIATLSGLVLKSTGYYIALAWMSFTIAFFLARTLRYVILSDAASDGIARASKRRLYLLLFISLIQPLFMFILTRHLNHFDTGAIKNLKT